MMNSTPCIGVFDSGVGGLSVLHKIHQQLPHIPTLYYADQAHLPYGPRPAAEIVALVTPIAAQLMAQGAQVIVIACNTASTPALAHLRALYPAFPFVGMEPAVKPAAEATQSGVIGVLATQGTLNGAPFQRVVQRYAQHVRVITQAAPEMVLMAENGDAHTPANRAIIRRLVGPMLDAGADQIALACTHFPFLIDVLQQEVGPHVRLIDPAPAVARQTARTLPAMPFPNTPHRYYTSGDAHAFRQKLHSLIGVDAPVTSLNFHTT
jgi:glutamate racemase